MLMNEFDVIIINESPLLHLFFLDINKESHVVVDWVEYWATNPLKLIMNKAIRRFKYFMTISEYIDKIIKQVNSHAITSVIRTP